MTAREETLRELVAQIREHDSVEAAFLAKSFTDRLVVIDFEAGARLPETIVASLRVTGLRGANAVYETGGADRSVSAIGVGTRHQFVDVQTRGQHRSYVVDQ